MLRSRYWCFCTQASGKNKQVADVKLAELAFTQMMKKTIYLGEEEREPRNPLLVLNNVFKGRSKSLIWEKFLHFTGKFYRMLRVMKYAIINLRNLPDKKKESYQCMFSLLREALECLGLELSASFFMSDFEIGIRDSFSATFPGIEVKGCACAVDTLSKHK